MTSGSTPENKASRFPFGNDPAKVDRYLAFWSRAHTRRPLVGFSLLGWFPFEAFSVCRSWPKDGDLLPSMVDPQEFLADYQRVLAEGDRLDDDVLRGACPAQGAIPWLSGMVGARLRILPDSVLGQEMNLDWDSALSVRLDPTSPWVAKYLQFLDVLVEFAAGRFPVSHSPEIGPTDLHALLRGHTQAILDLELEPERAERLLWRCAEVFAEFFRLSWERLPRFCGGYFDAQYGLWAPGSIARLQEDASAVLSPRLYRKFVQPVDRWLARQFDYPLIHLHSTSMFLLEAVLEIEEIRCIQINRDAVGWPLERLLPYFQQVQRAGRPLLIRGEFTPNELKQLLDALEPRGLFLQILVSSESEVEGLRWALGW